MLPQIQIRIQIQIQIMPTPVPAPRDGDVSTKSCQLVLPTILINVFYISTHFRIQVALKNVNISKISTQIPIQACSLCILNFKVTVLYEYEYSYTKYTIIYCWTTWMTMCVQCTHSHKRIARECIVPQGNAHVVQRQRTSHILYNKATHMLYNRKLINGRIGGRCGRFEEPPLKSGKVDAFLLSDLCYTI